MNKLTYQDCLELKEAGFPQEGYVIETEDCKCGQEQTVPGMKIHAPQSDCIVSNPSLEELIEACGIHFFKLISNLESKWTAQHENGTEYIGSSPSQAVARLWIALHK